MTTTPDPQNPATGFPTTTDAAAGSHPADRVDPVLVDGAYTKVVEPRSDNRLPLGDGTWYQLSRRYIVAQLVVNVIFLAIVIAAAVVVWILWEPMWVWIPAGVIVLITLITLIVLPRQARSIGYQLRHDDLVFRRGILWQRMVAVPYGRMQLVDITHGPLDRGFGIAQLKLVTAAAATGVTIPGLEQAAAERLRDTLIDVAETRRTGL